MFKTLVNQIFISSIQSSRGIRRFPQKRWHPKRKVVLYWANKELTQENKDFLKSTYNDINPISPDIKNISTQEWNPEMLRTGVLGMKIGVIPQWCNNGKRILCTLIQVLDNHVIQTKEPSADSSNHHVTVVGALSTGVHKFTEEYADMFKEAGVMPKRKITRFLTSPSCLLPPGTELTSRHFKVGHYVDAQAKTIGHGFQGVVKRWGFKGGPASHGNTKWHRRPGNIGGGAGKSKVFKGKKMPGKMGMKWRTGKALKILRINEEHNVLYIKGPGVPGPNHCYVRLYDTCSRHKRQSMQLNPPPNPTYIHQNHAPSQNSAPSQETFDDVLFRFENEFSVKN